VTSSEKYEKVANAIVDDLPACSVDYKDESRFQEFLTAISFWNDYGNMTTTMYPRVWFSSRSYVERQCPWQTLHHEWVHLKDQATFFGLLPWLPAGFNSLLFNFAYLFPQILAPLGFLGVLGNWVSPWFYLCFLFFVFVAPIPAPFRAWAELRAYRRSIEVRSSDDLMDNVERFTAPFTGPSYYYMWPFKTDVTVRLVQDSPYKDLMDKAL
jgi:hypothetical protein